MSSAKCKHSHPQKSKPSSRSKGKYSSQDVSKLLLIPKSDEERLREKISLSQNIKKRYEKTEKEETDKMVKILEKINKTENSCYDVVGVLLGKYVSLDEWSSFIKKSEYILEVLLTHSMNVMKKKHKLTINELKELINSIDLQIEQTYGEGDHLIDYACTSYAEMVVTIEEIKNYHCLLQFAFEWEYNQLIKQRKEFEKKIQNRIKDSEAMIKAGIRKDVYGMMDVNMLEMEKRNNTMKEILKEYENDISKRKELIKNISKHVEMMENDAGNDARKRYFPHIFYYRPDCTPDMELKIDIPIKKYLPI